MLQELISRVQEIAGNSYLYFDEAVVIKLNPHQEPLRVWAVAADFRNRLYIMDDCEHWEELEEKYETIVQSIYQRVAIIHSKMTA